MAFDLRTISGHLKVTSSKKGSAGPTLKPTGDEHSPSAEPDAVLFTDAASILQNAERLVTALPVVNSSLVSSISESLDNGSYVVDSERVAEKIIEFEQGLPG